MGYAPSRRLTCPTWQRWKGCVDPALLNQRTLMVPREMKVRVCVISCQLSTAIMVFLLWAASKFEGQGMVNTLFYKGIQRI